MNRLTGKFFSSVAGGFAAAIEIRESTPGYLFVQGENLSDIETGIREGLALHFRNSGLVSNWTLASLLKVDKDVYIAISKAVFTSKTHDYIVQTSICQRHSIFNHAGFVSYSIGNIRLTLPKFESEGPKPELLGQICVTFARALQANPPTADRVDELTDLIFSRTDQ